LLKDSYVLDFLGSTDRFLVRDLDDAIRRELETFLLELGAGFSSVARQKRIQLDGDDFYIDLIALRSTTANSDGWSWWN
jgi:predicted nuclease of restriction endonuclease-like (RecB) superfamily